MACIHVNRHDCTPTGGMLTWLPAKLAKNGMRVKTSADPWLKNKLRVYTASDANWLGVSVVVETFPRPFQDLSTCYRV